MPPRLSAEKAIQKRIEKWIDEDPSSLFTKRIEQITTPLQWLGAVLLPEALVREVLEKTLWAADVLVIDANYEEARNKPVGECDTVADGVHNWSMGAAAAVGAWDLAGPLGIAPALASMFTLALRTIKKIGACYGFDTSTSQEELIALEILFAATSTYHRDKVLALKAIRMNEASADKTRVVAAISQLSNPISANLIRRRALAGIPALGAVVGSSVNAWLLKDIGWAARNIYAMRRLEGAKAAKDEAVAPQQLPKAA